jgi:hypothetical protein
MTQKKSKDPEVTVFGELLSEEKKQKQENDPVFGFLLVFAGVILLLNSLEIVPWTIWAAMLKFWPILVILVGLKILLGKSILAQAIINIINFVVFASLLLFLLLEFAPQLIAWLPADFINYLKIWEFKSL